MSKTLILMVGLPRSGKTSKALEFGYPIVSPDAVRLAVHGHYFIAEAEGLIWTIARYMTTALFEAGHDTVILDACNTKRARRAQWISKKWTCKFCVMTASAKECRTRAKQVTGDTIMVSNLLDSINRMEREYESVTRDEGEIL